MTDYVWDGKGLPGEYYKTDPIGIIFGGDTLLFTRWYPLISYRAPFALLLGNAKVWITESNRLEARSTAAFVLTGDENVLSNGPGCTLKTFEPISVSGHLNHIINRGTITAYGSGIVRIEGNNNFYDSAGNISGPGSSNVDTISCDVKGLGNIISFDGTIMASHESSDVSLSTGESSRTTGDGQSRGIRIDGDQNEVRIKKRTVEGFALGIDLIGGGNIIKNYESEQGGIRAYKVAINIKGSSNNIDNAYSGSIKSERDGIIIEGGYNTLRVWNLKAANKGVVATGGHQNRLVLTGELDATSGVEFEGDSCSVGIEGSGRVKTTGTAISIHGLDFDVFNEGVISSLTGISLIGNNGKSQNYGIIESKIGVKIEGHQNILINQALIDAVGMAVFIKGDYYNFTNIGNIKGNIYLQGNYGYVINMREMRALGAGFQIIGDYNDFDNLGSFGSDGLGISIKGNENRFSSGGHIQSAEGPVLLINGNKNTLDLQGDESRIAGLDSVIEVIGSGNSIISSALITGVNNISMRNGISNSIVNSGIIDADGTAISIIGDEATIQNTGIISGKIALSLKGSYGRLEGSDMTRIRGTEIALRIEDDTNVFSDKGDIASEKIGISIIGNENSLCLMNITAPYGIQISGTLRPVSA
jgi:hypothetical protein